MSDASKEWHDLKKKYKSIQSDKEAAGLGNFWKGVEEDPKLTPDKEAAGLGNFWKGIEEDPNLKQNSKNVQNEEKKKDELAKQELDIDKQKLDEEKKVDKENLDEQKKEDKKLHLDLGPPEERLIKAALATAVICFLLWANFIGGSYRTPIMQAIFVSSTGPNPFIDSWDSILWTLLGVAAIATFYTNYKYDAMVPTLIIGVILVLMLAFFPLLSSFFSLGGGGDMFIGLRCSFLTIFGQTPSDCMTVGPTPPVKVGKYQVVKASFESGIGGVIYKDKDNQVSYDGYQLSLQVQNPSDTRAVSNFRIITSGDQFNDNLDTAIVRSGVINTKQQIKLGNIELDDKSTCSEASPCTLDPGEIKRIVLIVTPISCAPLAEVDCKLRDVCKWNIESKACETGQDTLTTEAVARVKYAYDFEGEGHYDFIVGNSYDMVSPREASRAPKTSSEGPLDVDIVFAPSVYVFHTGTAYSTLYVKVQLSKQASGLDKIRPMNRIEITRLADGVLAKPADCTSSWGESIPLEQDTRYDFAEFMDLSKLAVVPRLTTQTNAQTYTCAYTIASANLAAPGAETIPFIVSVDYTHEDIALLNFIRVLKGTETVTA